MFLIEKAGPKNARPMDYVILKIALMLLTVHCAQPLRADDDPDSWICKVKELIRDPKITSRDDFWERFGAASTDETAAKKLYLELKGNRTPEAPKPVVPSIPVVASKNYTKEYDKLKNDGLRRNADEVVEYLKQGQAGIAKMKSIGSFNYEKLPQISPTAWGVRINDGYRVIFEDDGKTIKLLMVNDQPYRH